MALQARDEPFILVSGLTASGYTRRTYTLKEWGLYKNLIILDVWSDTVELIGSLV